MWLFNKLKSIFNYVVDVFSWINLFGSKKAKNVNPPLPQIKIKNINIAPVKKIILDEEIENSFKPIFCPYIDSKKRPIWAEKCYKMFLVGEIGSIAQLNHELESHRLLESAKQFLKLRN